MSNQVKKWVYTLVAGLGLPVLIFLVLFISTWGTYPVPATLSEDSQLPRLSADAGFTVHGEIKGPAGAPLVVVLHDGPGSDYRSLLPLEALAKDYRILFYDQMGSGLSPRVPEEQLGIEHSLKRLESLIETYGKGQKVRLIGHGWGGMLASAYAGKHPQNVAQMALLEPGFLNADMAGQVLPALSRSTLAFIVSTTTRWVQALHVSGPDADAREDFIFAKIRHQPLFYCEQQIPANWSEYNWRAGFRAWKTITQSTLDERGTLHLDFTDGLADFEPHVLFVASSCNTVTGRAFQARQTRLFKQASVAQIKKSGHELLIDNPVDTLDVLQRYFAGTYFEDPSAAAADNTGVDG